MKYFGDNRSACANVGSQSPNQESDYTEVKNLCLSLKDQAIALGIVSDKRPRHNRLGLCNEFAGDQAEMATLPGLKQQPVRPERDRMAITICRAVIDPESDYETLHLSGDCIWAAQFLEGDESLALFVPERQTYAFQAL